jgi:hypothetical protein
MNILKKVWRKWKYIAGIIGTFQSRILLTIFYFVILLPAGIIFRIFKDPLKIKSPLKTAWIDKTSQCESLDEMRKQY